MQVWSAEADSELRRLNLRPFCHQHIILMAVSTD